MTAAAPPLKTGSATVIVHRGRDAEACPDEWSDLRRRCGAASPSMRHEWLAVLREGLGHEPYCIELREGSTTRGLLPLEFLNTRLFGKFLVGMPYLNVGGVIAENDADARQLIDAAVELADDLDVRYLELRHERRWPHAAFTYESTQKVHMRLELPRDQEVLWKQFNPKVRNQRPRRS